MTITLHLNGKHRRIGGKRNNFSVIVPNGLITCSEDEKIVMTMHDFMTPYTFYNVNQNTNKLKVSIDGGVNWFVVLVTPGFYDITNIGNAVKLAINAVFSSLIVNTQFTTSEQIKITASAPFALDFDFDGSIGRMLGFIDEPVKYSFNNIIIGDHNLHLTPDHAIFVQCEHESKHLQINIQSKKVTYAHVIARIPIQVAPGGTIYAAGLTPQPLEFNSSYVDELKFRITNERNEMIDLKDDVHMTLNFEIVKKSASDPILEELQKLNNTMQEMYRIQMMSFLNEK
tara:strand:+ start:355 stop:1209 length:855 start_codon:yes stop_codon:yes gene_type:complete